MTGNDARHILWRWNNLKEHGKIPAEAALLLLLMKYMGRLSQGELAELEEMRLECPLCDLYIDNCADYDDRCKDCPWNKYYKEGGYVCDEWGASVSKVHGIRQALHNPRVVALRVHMLVEWIQMERTATHP